MDWSNENRHAPSWFQDAKFGLFFHWGPYSVPAYGNEWYSRNMYYKGSDQNRYHEKTYGSLHDFGYKDFLPLWKADRFDPEAWAELVDRSGARYAGPVSEHGDGFSMWNSQVNPINAVQYGPKRDVVGECFEAFRKRGIRTLATFHHQWLWGWFMSTDPEADVYDPANEKFYGPSLPLETCRYDPYRHPDERFCENWMRKIIEVTDHYQPDVLYFDGRAFLIDERYRRATLKHYYQVMADKEPVMTFKQEDFPQGTGVTDIECGRFAQAKILPWQTDDRLEDQVTWCHVNPIRYKSSGRILRQLCDIVAKNGNLLLNVGPRADGSFAPEAEKILTEIGEWLHVNGDAIYGTRPWVLAEEGPTTSEDVSFDAKMQEDQITKGQAGAVEQLDLTEKDYRFTQRDGKVYAICMGWPDNGEFHLKAMREGGPIGAKIRRVTLLGSPQPLSFVQDRSQLTVKAPIERPCRDCFSLCMEV